MLFPYTKKKRGDRTLTVRPTPVDSGDIIVTIQSPSSIPLTLHLAVASRHMDFQKGIHSCKHGSYLYCKSAWL